MGERRPPPAFRDLNKERDESQLVSDWDPDFEEYREYYDNRAWGFPGISWQWKKFSNCTVGVVTYRNGKGELVGIHTYFFKAMFGHHAGHTETLVRPDSRRQGIGTKLLIESIKRFHINIHHQHYTKDGYALVKKVRNILSRDPKWAAYFSLNSVMARQVSPLAPSWW
ncbi:GNAT family N-acetyltransferase [Mycobacterium colombiense]